MTGMQVDRRRSGAVPTWVLAALAVVLVAGFMAWLAVTAEPSTPGGGEEVEPEDPMAEEAASVPAIGLLDFADDPRQYEGTEIRLVDVLVDSRLGQNAIWLKLPNQGLYLVRGTVTNTGMVQAGDRVTVAGPVLPMTDSVVAAWTNEGAITADQEMEARYATSYIDAWYVAPPEQQAGAADTAQEG